MIGRPYKFLNPNILCKIFQLLDYLILDRNVMFQQSDPRPHKLLSVSLES